MKISRKVLFVLSVSFFFCFVEAKEKVILDTDMVEVFDDGIAMMMLQLNPEIDLVGVTVVIGNTWVSEGTAFTLRQLEAIKAENVPVAMGVRHPLRPGRYESISYERSLYGIGDDVWIGAFGYPEPESWQVVYQKQYEVSPQMQPIEQHAVDFIIEQVKKAPGEITIAAIGACANLAMAVQKAPEIIPLIKRVVYMGGSFFGPGNVTPTAEFNWWIDPESARIAIRSPFKEQIIVGLDVCEKVTFKKSQYEEVRKRVKNTIISDMLNKNELVALYEKDPEYTHYLWDIIAVAIIIDPSLVTEKVTCSVDVSADFGYGYGQSIAYRSRSPAGTQEADIVTDVNISALWQLIYEYCGIF